MKHAEEWLLFPENIGWRLAFDEFSLYNGELYTFVTNRDTQTQERSLIAVVTKTKSENVTAVLQQICQEQHYGVEGVTLDLPNSMRKIVQTAFPKAKRVIDRFQIQELVCNTVQKLRIKYRWDAPYNNPMTRRKKPSKKAKIMNRTDILTEILVRNSSCAHSISFSSRTTMDRQAETTGRNTV